MRILTIAALAACLLASPVAAQRSDGLTGTRVRVTAPNFVPAPVTGMVTSYTQQGITLTDELTGDTLVLPLRSVLRLDEFAGGSAASTAWYRGRMGAFIGAGLGLVVGPVSAKLTDRGMGESALLGGAVGAGAGFVVGALWGAATPRERWKWTCSPGATTPPCAPRPYPRPLRRPRLSRSRRPSSEGVAKPGAATLTS